VAGRPCGGQPERKDGAVAHYDPRFAVGERDSGVRKVSRVTWRAGLVGVAVSGLFAAALAHPADGSSQPRHSEQIVIPGQPPQPATGGSQVTSGAS
jgi:hypothetical protein